MHEQSLPFLAGLWLHAVFASVTDAAACGRAWLVLRALYTLIWAAVGSKKCPLAIGITTVPMYMIIWFLLLGTAIANPGAAILPWPVLRVQLPEALHFKVAAVGLPCLILTMVPAILVNIVFNTRFAKAKAE
jgi:hypothetical protein